MDSQELAKQVRERELQIDKDMHRSDKTLKQVLCPEGERRGARCAWREKEEGINKRRGEKPGRT